MTGEELAQEVLGVLCREYKLSTEQVLAAMRDRASVNNVAIRHIKVMFPTLFDIGCYSHTLDLVGSKFHLPTLEEFVKPWISLFSHSMKELCCVSSFCVLSLSIAVNLLSIKGYFSSIIVKSFKQCSTA